MTSQILVAELSERGSNSHRPASSWVWIAVAIAAALVLIFRSAPGIRIFSQTIDEPCHIGSAVALYEAHAHVMVVDHGPLTRLVAGLPLHLAGVYTPLPSPDPHTVNSDVTSINFGADVMFGGPVPYQRVLTLARWAMLLVFPPVCLLYVFLLGRLLGGSNSAGARTGAAAVVFFSLDPTLLGHAFLVCTDVAACAGFLASLYHGLRWLAWPTIGTAAAAGVALALAFACKFTCILVVPGLILVALLGGGRAIAAASGHSSSDRPRFTIASSFFQFMILAVAAFFTLWATYLFAIGRMANQDIFSTRLHTIVPPILTRTPIPMPSLGLGLLYMLRHAHEGHANYLNGQLGVSGHWYYFLEAFALKEPLAVIAAIVVAAIVFITKADDRKHWRTAIVPLIPAGVYLLIAMRGNVNLGIRHILPVLPCLYLFISLVLVNQAGNAAASRWRSFSLLALIVIACIETIPAEPNYLSYFNVIAGGPTGGERYLLDSNLDWDQDVARLADYLNSPKNKGRAYSLRIFDLQPQRLAAALNLKPESATTAPSGLFAISLNVSHQLFGYGIALDKTVVYPTNYDWVKRYPHVARIGTSIDVYDLDAPPQTSASR